MKYRKGYKYQLAEPETFQTEIFPPADIHHTFFMLETSGLLTARAGYAWDGCSGPTWDDKTNQAPSLFHDILAQMMRNGLIPHSWWPQVDHEFERCALQQKKVMHPLRLWYYMRELKLVKGNYGDPKKKKKIYEV